MKLTSAQEREIIMIESGATTEILLAPVRIASIWFKLIDKKLVKVSQKNHHPILTGAGQAEYHRIFMRDVLKGKVQS